MLRVSAGPDGSDQVQVDPATLIEGARIFDERCAPCHGDTGHGDGALAEVLPIKPRDYHKEPFKWGTRPSDILRTVTDGRSGIMPPFKGELSQREMWAVSYVVWSWVPADRREGDPPEGAPAPN
jgi:cytochrome c oxidase cbb3-type subunit 3